jgi:hypothetical protein
MTIRGGVWIAAVLCAALNVHVAKANLVLNGNFATGDFTNWTLATTPNGTLGSPTVTTFDFGSGAVNAAQFQVGDVNFDGTQQGGSIAQTIATGAGLFTFSADIAAQGSNNVEAGVFTALLDGTPLDTVDLGFINGTLISSLSFSASVGAGNHNLEILITRPYQKLPTEFVSDITADAPSATSVPEPGSLTLLAGGLFGIAVLRRRRKSK